MISIFIPILNEEINLPSCLQSVSWSNDIVVLDSGSTDKSIDIARAAGARVLTRPFDNWASHLNWAVENIEFKNPWVYYCDADEIVPQDLREELQKVALATGRNEVAYRVRFKNMFMGRWIRWSSLYPSWILRFFKPKHVRWDRSVHQVATVTGPEGRLRTHFQHYSFRKGLDAWIAKHNKYSTQEAHETLAALRAGGMTWGGLFSRDPIVRRKSVKELSYRLPFRPTFRFLYHFFIRFGFLDGSAGLTYARLMAMYEYMIVIKIRELRRKERGLSG